MQNRREPSELHTLKGIIEDQELVEVRNEAEAVSGQMNRRVEGRLYARSSRMVGDEDGEC